MDSKLISSQGIILSLYAGSRVLRYLTGSPNRTIIATVEIIHQEQYINNLYHKFPINKDIYTDVLKYLISLYFI